MKDPISLDALCFPGTSSSFWITPAQTSPGRFIEEASAQLGSFLPSLIWAIVILLVGWLVATIAASVIKNLLKRTRLDDRLANWVLGQSPEQDIPVESWVATAVYWIILLFTIVAFLNALNLEVVSAPLNDFLQQIFAYLPRIGGAALLLGVGWIIATLVKILVTRGLSRFNLDDQLASQTGGRSPFFVNETIGNVLYWFILLLFLPLVLSTLGLQGLLQPVEGLIDDFLQAIPRILTAAVIVAAGWLIATFVRGIVSNLLVNTGADQFGTRFGLKADSQEGVSLSSLTGTVVFVLILIPAVISALEKLAIEAITAPTVSMLEQILAAVPRVLMAGLVIVVFYFIGRFVADLVTDILTNVGFNNILSFLGLPDINPPAQPEGQPTLDSEGRPIAAVQSPQRTPSEIVGIITLVGIVLFGIVTATEILQFDQLTAIVQAILRVGARVLSGIVVFAVGLYLANIAFRVVNAMGTGQANVLAQTARISIIALVGAMALQQMGIATNIVNLAFGLLLGAVAVAVAISFGLGGRDVASEQLREWIAAFKQRQ